MAKKIFRVTVHREPLYILVAAETQTQACEIAEQNADEEADNQESEWDAMSVAAITSVDQLASDEHGVLPYGPKDNEPDRDWTVEEHLAQK